jgi:DNA (cytosine-5)-methyltransferase 1
MEHFRIYSFGFPCQDISIANTAAQGVDGEKSGLWTESIRVIGMDRPHIAILENSPKLTFRGLDRILYALAEIGYDAEWHCLSASDFGAPFQGERIYIIAYEANSIRFKESGVSSQFTDQERPTPWKPYGAACYDDWKKTITEFYRLDDGLSKELGASEIHAYGNSVVPEITEFLFRKVICSIKKEPVAAGSKLPKG